LKVYVPAVFAVVVALAAPLKVTVAPPPPFVGLIVPEILNAGPGSALTVKFNPDTLAPPIVALLLAGVNLNPVWLGVTV
jgi:hypothetical protein